MKFLSHFVISYLDLIAGVSLSVSFLSLLFGLSVNKRTGKGAGRKQLARSRFKSGQVTFPAPTFADLLRGLQSNAFYRGHGRPPTTGREVPIALGRAGSVARPNYEWQQLTEGLFIQRGGLDVLAPRGQVSSSLANEAPEQLGEGAINETLCGTAR